MEDYVDEQNVGGLDYEIHDFGRGKPNGVATLDEAGRIPASQLPETVMEIRGGWNASTNTPHLVDGTGNLGDVYIVKVAGTRDLGSGETTFVVNDRIMYNADNIWEQLPAGAVASVNDKTGNVQLKAVDIPLEPGSPKTTAQAIVEARYNHTVTDASAAEAVIRELTITSLTLDATSMSSFDVYFVNGWSQEIQLNLNNAGAKNIKVWKGGTKVSLNTAGNSGTTLKLTYDGIDFVVIGNPDVLTSSDGFAVTKADGTIYYNKDGVDNKIESSSTGIKGFSPASAGVKSQSNTATENQALITFPGIWELQNMISFKVRITEYTTGKLSEALCYGYAFNDNVWHQCKAFSTGNTNLKVRFGAKNDGTAAVLIKWADAYLNDYPQVDVFDVSSGYVGIDYDASKITVELSETPDFVRDDVIIDSVAMTNAFYAEEGGSITVTNSAEDAPQDSYGVISSTDGKVKTATRFTFAKVWTWIKNKLTRVTERVWFGSGEGTYTKMAMFTDGNGFTFENPLTEDTPTAPDKPFRIQKRGGYAGTMQVGQIQVDGVSNKHNYNENLRLNRASSTSWATIALGGANGSTEGTDDSTWCFGATPANDSSRPNSLIINRNGSSGAGCASFFKDRHNCIGLDAGAFTSKVFGFSPLAQTMKGGNYSGYVQIRLPNAWINNMLSFTIRVSEYDGGLWEGTVYGYAYDDGKWHNCSASEILSTSSAGMKVYMGSGSDGVATVLLRWEDRVIGSYPQVDVYNFSCGHAGIGYDVSQIDITITDSIDWAREDWSKILRTTVTESSVSNAVSNRGFGTSEFTWYQSSSDFAGRSGGWASYLISNHGSGASYYNQIICMPFWASPEYGRAMGNGNVEWHHFITDENIAGQTVSGVYDYNDSSRKIQIGYAGAGLTADTLSYVAGFTDGGTKIKDVSEDTLRGWLGINSDYDRIMSTISSACNSVYTSLKAQIVPSITFSQSSGLSLNTYTYSNGKTLVCIYSEYAYEIGTNETLLDYIYQLRRVNHKIIKNGTPCSFLCRHSALPIAGNGYTVFLNYSGTYHFYAVELNDNYVIAFGDTTQVSNYGDWIMKQLYGNDVRGTGGGSGMASMYYNLSIGMSYANYS